MIATVKRLAQILLSAYQHTYYKIMVSLQQILIYLLVRLCLILVSVKLSILLETGNLSFLENIFISLVTYSNNIDNTNKLAPFFLTAALFPKDAVPKTVPEISRSASTLGFSAVLVLRAQYQPVVYTTSSVRASFRTFFVYFVGSSTSWFSQNG